MEIIKREENGLMTNDLVFAKVKSNAIIPSKKDENAGYDIYACFDEDYIIIPSHTTKLISTGIASAMTNKYYLNVAERGSTGSKGIKYSAGIIDSSYRGEIFITLTNSNNVPVVISKLNEEDKRVTLMNDLGCIIHPYSKAIAQLIVHEVPKMNVKEITYKELKMIPSERGTGALGSSGK